MLNVEVGHVTYNVTINHCAALYSSMLVRSPCYKLGRGKTGFRRQLLALKFLVSMHAPKLSRIMQS